MGFISIFIFLLKYGPSIFQLIKSAVELIQWLKKNDTESVSQFADPEPIKVRLHDMARRCKDKKDRGELNDFVTRLQIRKLEVQRKQKGL